MQRSVRQHLWLHGKKKGEEMGAQHRLILTKTNYRLRFTNGKITTNQFVFEGVELSQGLE